MRALQTRFHDALLDSTQPVPPDLRDGAGLPAGRRFDVYRNNVAASLTEALELGFPAVRSLIGQDNFKTISAVFLRRTPPSDPRMMLYGKEFPAFLDAFEAVSHIPYLADVARLEQAQREAYHAADAPAFSPGTLAQLAPEDLATARFGIAPAVRLVRSRWPVHDIWRFASDHTAQKPAAKPQDVLVTRPAFDPDLQVLPGGGAAFLTALMAGHPLGRACDAGASNPAFDLSEMLALLLQGNAITDVKTES